MKTLTKAKISEVAGNICFGVAAFDAVMAYVSSQNDVLKGQFFEYLASAGVLLIAAVINWHLAEQAHAQVKREKKP